MTESNVLARYTNRQGNNVTIREYYGGSIYSSLHVEVAATQQTSLRALSAQCAAARKRFAAGKVLVSQGGSSGPSGESLTNVYS